MTLSGQVRVRVLLGVLGALLVTNPASGASQCSKPGSRCKRCNASGVCVACRTGYTLDAGSCISCANSLEGQLCAFPSCPPRAEQCTQCKTSVGIGGHSSACSTITLGVYKNAQGACRKCPLPCASCDQTGRCTDCTGAVNCSACGLSATPWGYNPDCSQCGRLLKGGKCVSCPPLCLTCASPTVCTKCLESIFYNQGHGRGDLYAVYLDAKGWCRECRLPGCSRCSPSNTTRCLECAAGFFLLDGQCKSCSEVIPDCIRCTLGRGGAPVCIACYSTPLDRATGRCVACNDPLCAECPAGRNICNRCKYSYEEPGTGSDLQVYEAANGTCQTCPAGCNQCAPNGSCQSCEDGYKKAGGRCTKCKYESQCVRCGDGCKTCSPDGSACIKCSVSIWGRDTKCRRCRFTGAKHCMSCSRNYLKCNPGQCEDPFWRDRLGRCRNCTTSVAHCAACNDGTGACSACEYGYGLHSTAAGGTTCLPCEKACGDCRAGPKCAGCVGGYALARNGTCVACVDKNCVTCSSAKTCTSCAAGFEAVAGKCTPCADPNCGDCSRDLKTCYACRDGHEFERDVYATTRGRCQRCQPQNCRWCADPCTGALARCTDCLEGYRLEAASNATCAACATAAASEPCDCPAGDLVCRRCAVLNCGDCREGVHTCSACKTGFWKDGDSSCVRAKDRCPAGSTYNAEWDYCEIA